MLQRARDAFAFLSMVAADREQFHCIGMAIRAPLLFRFRRLRALPPVDEM
jgi:hypothetical protein